MKRFINVSESLKQELEAIRDQREGLETLNEVILHVLRENLGGNRPTTKHEPALTETVRVSEYTRMVLGRIKEKEGHGDFDSVIRSRCGLAPRNTGREEPVSIGKLPE